MPMGACAPVEVKTANVASSKPSIYQIQQSMDNTIAELGELVMATLAFVDFDQAQTTSLDPGIEVKDFRDAMASNSHKLYLITNAVRQLQDALKGD